MNEIKKVPKKLHGRETIMIDPQIIRWRKELKKRGTVLGKASKKQDKLNAERREERAELPIEKRKWF